MTERAEQELAPLYIPFYFDEDVSSGVVSNLRTRGFDVVSAREVEMLKKDDDTQLAYSVAQRRAIVTHNRADFEVRHYRWMETGQKHYGIIIAKRRPQDAEIVAKFFALLNSVTAEEMENQLRYL